jgi:glucose/mannose transport system substrate-binding protein
VAQGNDAPSQVPRLTKRSRLFRAAWLAVVSSLFSVACAPAPSDVRLRVYSWWGRDEAAPFDALKNRFHASHPAISVENPADPDAENQRDRVAAELLAGGSPDTFQANLGADLLQWAEVVSNGHTINKLEPLGDLFNGTGMAVHVHEDIQRGVTAGTPGELYAVPLNIHRLNVVYYDRVRFEQELGRSDFFTIQELCPENLGSAEVVPNGIAIGRKDDFSLFLFVFENVLPALTNAKFYNALLRGEEPEPIGPSGDYVDDLIRVFTCVQQLSKWFSPESQDYSWADAIGAVKKKKALITVTGDWGNLQFKSELESGRIAVVPFPGSEGTFVYTSDTFPLPADAPHAKETRTFLEYMASADTQKRFSDDKGSIPARDDAEIGESLHELRTQTRNDFQRLEHALATSGLHPPYYPRMELIIKLRQLVSGQATVNDVLNEFMADQPLLQRWQQQLRGE